MQSDFFLQQVKLPPTGHLNECRFKALASFFRSAGCHSLSPLQAFPAHLLPCISFPSLSLSIYIYMLAQIFYSQQLVLVAYSLCACVCIWMFSWTSTCLPTGLPVSYFINKSLKSSCCLLSLHLGRVPVSLHDQPWQSDGCPWNADILSFPEDFNSLTLVQFFQNWLSHQPQPCFVLRAI